MAQYIIQGIQGALAALNDLLSKKTASRKASETMKQEVLDTLKSIRDAIDQQASVSRSVLAEIGKGNEAVSNHLENLHGEIKTLNA